MPKSPMRPTGRSSPPLSSKPLTNSGAYASQARTQQMAIYTDDEYDQMSLASRPEDWDPRDEDLEPAEIWEGDLDWDRIIGDTFN